MGEVLRVEDPHYAISTRTEQLIVSLRDSASIGSSHLDVHPPAELPVLRKTVQAPVASE